MTYEEMKRTMEFLLRWQAKFSVEIEQLKETQKQQGENIRLLFESTMVMQSQSEGIMSQAEADRAATRELFNSMVVEMRGGFDKLILGNEVTRDLANKVAALEIQTSQRVTNLEHRVGDIETKL